MRQIRSLTQGHLKERLRREIRRNALVSAHVTLIHPGDLYLPPGTSPAETNGLNRRGVLLRPGLHLGKETFV